MDLLFVPVPLFDREMAVVAYYFRYQKGNGLMVEAKPASMFDGAMNSPLLEAFRLVGVEPFAMDKPIFVPISSMMLLGELAGQCPEPYDKIVLLLRNDVNPTEEYISNMRSLKARGFRFAMHETAELLTYLPIIAECEYLFLDQRSRAASAVNPAALPLGARHLKLAATHINTLDGYTVLTRKGFAMYEGRFYRLPVTKGKNDVKPLKANLIRLLNLVQGENFEFDEATAIIERDPSLTLSLMRMINSPYLGLSQKIKTIQHAVTILGQSEVRKWASTSVTRSLSADKPDEISRLSLIRAKFADNLADAMKMSERRQSVFLAGLFSVLDIILDLPMNDALAMVHVDDDIHDALVDRKGPFYPVLQLIFSYEAADWQSVSRQLIIEDISVDTVYDSYINAALWYKDLIEDNPEEIKENVE